jgi:hypothetical protein
MAGTPASTLNVDAGRAPLAGGGAAASVLAPGFVNSTLDTLELPIEVRLGRLVWNLGRVLELRVGDAVPVGPDGDDAVTLYVQGRPYAAGDLVVVDGRFAFRVRELRSGCEGGGRP